MGLLQGRRAEREATAREETDEAAEGRAAGGVRVLVVDDEETILEFLGMGLGYEGFTVETATDGPAALAAAARFRPDLVLLDVMLPGLDGVEVCRRLRATGDVAIIMLTAKGEVDERVTGLDAGADDYVPKPFRFPELLVVQRENLCATCGQPA